jgi:hypothetical protein
MMGPFLSRERERSQGRGPGLSQISSDVLQKSARTASAAGATSSINYVAVFM